MASASAKATLVAANSTTDVAVVLKVSTLSNPHTLFIGVILFLLRSWHDVQYLVLGTAYYVHDYVQSIC